MADRILMPLPATDANGAVVAGAVASFFESGTNTPLVVYAEPAGTTALGTSITANASGAFAAVYSNSAVKMDIKTPAGVSLPGFPDDNWPIVPSVGVGASTITFNPIPNNAETNVQSAIAKNTTLLTPLVTPPAGALVGTTAIQTLTNKVLTAPVINVGSDAEGDVYYRNASGAFTRLAVGDDDDTLTLASGVPAWSNNKISDVEASNSAALTCLFSAGYKSLRANVNALIPATTGAHLLLEFTADGGSTWITTGYSYAYAGGGVGASNFGGDNAASEIQLSMNVLPVFRDGTADAGFSGIIEVIDPDATTFTTARYEGFYESASNFMRHVSGGGHLASAAAIDGFRVRFDNGNITSGTLSVRGLI